MSVDTYLKARADFLRAHGELDRLAATLNHVAGHIMNSRDRFSFTNTGVGLPAEVVFNPENPTLNGEDWKSANQIMALIAEWHRARGQLKGTWTGLTQDQRDGLQPPPKQAQL